jgi:hypothetical protein
MSPRASIIQRIVTYAWSADIFYCISHHRYVRMRTAASSHSRPGYFLCVFPRQRKTTDLLSARMACSAGRHIWPHAWSSSHSKCSQAGCPLVNCDFRESALEGGYTLESPSTQKQRGTRAMFTLTCNATFSMHLPQLLTKGIMY